MADAVTSVVAFNGTKQYAVRLTNVCDGTGESAVVKIDVSTLLKEAGGGALPVAATECRIMEIQWNIYGFSEVKLLWDANTDDLAQTLSGNGYRSYWDQGGLKNPKSTGWTGDINLTTTTNTSGNHYDILLVVQLS
jgi:hypothetical protein